MLMQTKFYRSLIPQDLVVRPRLLDNIERGLGRPLTLISAPAGYGKTTLVSSFLETSARAHVWISLDESDNDLSLFLDYLLAAIDSVFPGSMQRTRSFLQGTSLPPVSVIADSLINELAILEHEFILVLDDIDAISDANIHSLLVALLRYPPRNMHLMLLARKDPPLPLEHLRAYDKMTEIRLRELRFSLEETAAFIGKSVDAPLRDEVIAALTERTEGWAVGLRLAALALRYGRDIEHNIAELPTQNRYVMDYLVSDVLSRIPPEIDDFLIRTSILDTFCAPLCAAILGPDHTTHGEEATLQWLEEANLFIVSLDDQRLWHRYHHLFRGVLHRRLTNKLDANQIDSMYIRASAWYASQGSIESALRHALAGHDTAGAVQLVAQHRHHVLNTEQRPRLERWLSAFPPTTLVQYPDLLLSRAWIAELGRSDARTVLNTVAQAQTLVDAMVDQPERAGQLQGEIDAILAIEKSFAANDPPGAIALATRALETMPHEWYMARVEAWLHLAIAYQMSGQLDRAYAILAAAEGEDTADIAAPRVRLSGSRCFIYWMAADLPRTLQLAHPVASVSQATDQRNESLTWGHYFLASCYYQRNDLAAAEVHANAVHEQRHVCHRIAVVQCAIVLGAIHQAHGRPDEARLALDRVGDFLREIHNEALQPLVQAFGAELAAMQGDLDTAVRWATTIGPLVPLGIMAFFYAPQLTLPKVLLRMNTPASRQQAVEALARLHTFVTATHNTRFTIDVLALQALCYDVQGDEPAALQALEQAVTMAQPGGFIRVFVDLGTAMARLMRRLARQGIAVDYIEEVLNAFPSRSSYPHPPSSGPAPQADLVESLTRRECEILALLAQWLTVKEIAQILVLSEGTVKRHIANIYQKLAVNKRSEAIAAAIALGILPVQP